MLAADAHSLRIQVETGQQEGAVNRTDPPLLYCTVFYKPMHGGWTQQVYPARGLRFLNLRGLACGQSYEVYSTCANAVGASAESVRLDSVRTLGGKPRDPMGGRSTVVPAVHPTNHSVRLDLFRWNDDVCPVEYFVISYKRENVRWV